MTDANPSSWMLVMDKVTNGLFGLGGVAPGAWIGYWKESRQRQQRNRSYWSALSAEVDLCKGYGAAYVRDDVKAPLYRLSTIAYDNAFPARLGTGAVTEEEAQSILRFYSQVVQINRGLEYAHTARQDDDLLDGEVSRLRQKASALIDDPNFGDPGGPYYQRVRECRELREADIARALKAASNPFADVPMFIVGGALCLPPGGQLTMTAASLILRTRICQVRFTVESSGGTSYMVPRTGGRVEKLPNGDSRYETRVVRVDVEIARFALRAHHTDAEKHIGWCHRLVESAHEWFRPAEPEPPEPLQPWIRPGPVAPGAI